MSGARRGAHWALGATALAAAAGTASCGRPPIVAAAPALRIEHVVVYRNGVAYFERAGHVDGGEVRFKMQGSEVGDFLATLAIMERGGSTVRAAAFPLEDDDDSNGSNDGNGDDKSPGPDGGAPVHAADADQKKRLETVVLSLDGQSHNLQVGYVAESPVWRPSYRLVVHGPGDADLQAWGVVENVSGEDWKDVKLSLVAGAPLAFRADLGKPVIPERPTVTDDGEVVASVPHAETTLAQAPPPAAPMPAAPAPAPQVFREEAPGTSRKRPSAGGHRSGAGAAPADAEMESAPPPDAVLAAAPPPPPPAPEAVSRPRNLLSLAAVGVEGGVTRYDLPQPITVPDHSATMVMLLSRQVSGEALYLFAPDDGVADSQNHPFRVGRFVNSTPGMLERGPIAVFRDGEFLGQGMLDPLPPGATATVPFALERSIAIEVDHKFDELGSRLAKIESGVLTIERDRVVQTDYRLRNGGDAEAKLLVKHPRVPGARLHGQPPGTEDNVGTGTALVPATVPAHGAAELVVDERAAEREQADWFGALADDAIKAYVADPKSDRGAVQKLNAAWVVRADLVKKRDARNGLSRQENDLSRATDETRRNLRAIEKNKTAEALRQKLTARLADAASKMDDINRKIVELDSQLAELGVQFSEATRDLRVVVPATEP